MAGCDRFRRPQSWGMAIKRCPECGGKVSTGHKNVSRIEDTYGHASHYRPRGEVVEYRMRAR